MKSNREGHILLKCIRGFTLLELLVATTILALLLTLLFSIVSEITTSWQRSEGRKERQTTARIALNMMKSDLQSALFLKSEDKRLQFVVNPASLAGTYQQSAFWQNLAGENESDLHEVGYFIQWPENRRAGELCRYRVAADDPQSIIFDPIQWLSPSRIQTHAPGSLDASANGLIMENVLGLWIRVYDKDGNLLPDYDSRATTNSPASAEIEFVVADSRTMTRIQDKTSIKSLSAQSQRAIDLIEQLPPAVKAGSQLFQSRIPLSSP